MVSADLYLDWQYLDESVNGIMNYSYHFTGTDYDYLDYWLLGLRGDTLSCDWSQPVADTRVLRSSISGIPDRTATGPITVGNAGVAVNPPPSNEMVTMEASDIPHFVYYLAH